MTLYFRRIEPEYWLDDPPAWLDPDDVEGRQISDLSYRMKTNTISVYALPDAGASTLTRVCAAMVATRQRVEDITYFVFDDALLQRASVQIDKTVGATGDPAVDEWHRDLVRIAGTSLVRLARELRNCDALRTLKEDIESELVFALGTEKRYPHPPQIAAHLRKKALI
ncbi:MAG: hypothetical protein V4550_09085 [Gemmatimonadota bacterium]